MGSSIRARFHHVALLVEDLEATVLRFSTASFPMYYALPFPTYPLKPHGSIREQNRPLGGGVFRGTGVVAFYKMIANASVGFQGDRPIWENALKEEVAIPCDTVRVVTSSPAARPVRRAIPILLR